MTTVSNHTHAHIWEGVVAHRNVKRKGEGRRREDDK